MPTLDSLPAPAIILGNNNGGGRWSQLPPSQNVQMELITRARQNLTAFFGVGTSTKNPLASSSPAAALPRVLPKTAYANLGELIGQEQLAGTSQMLCHYQNKSNGNFNEQQPISLICQLGCCAHFPGGCCTLDDAGTSNGVQSIASISTAYHWVLVLLCAFILCVFVSTLAMLALYWANRKQQQRRRRFLLAEKYSLGIGSSSAISRPSSYGAPSMASSSSNGQPPNAQPPFCGYKQIGGCSQHFRQFYSANSPGQFFAVATDRHPSNHQFGGLHLLHPYGYGPSHSNENINNNNINNNNNNGSPVSSSSAYHAPDEVFFRSSF